MGSGYLTEPATLLINVVLGLYISMVMLRFLFQLVRADFYNPLCQSIVAVTDLLLRPLRRIVPGLRGIDIPSVVLMLALQMLEIWLKATVIGFAPELVWLVVMAIGELLRLAIYIFIGAIFIQVIISWISPGAYNPMTQLLYSLSRPVLKPARAVVPPLGGLDFSPVVALVGLQLINMLLVKPIFVVANGLL